MATGGLLIVAFILAVVMIRRQFKSVIERLFIYLLISTLLQETVFISNVVVQPTFTFMDAGQVCAILGALNLYTSILVQIFVISTVLYLLSRVTNKITFLQQNSQSCARFLEFCFVASVFLFPLIVCLALSYTNLFGLSIAWCWVKEFNEECKITKTSMAMMSFYMVYGVMSIVSVVVLVTVYCKISHKIKVATHLKNRAMILTVCILVDVAISLFASIIVSSSHENHTLYIYTTIISLYDFIYPIGFLVVVKYQALLAVIRKKEHSTTPLLSGSQINASAPFSNRVSPRSTTVTMTIQGTGEFDSYIHIE